MSGLSEKIIPRALKECSHLVNDLKARNDCSSLDHLELSATDGHSVGKDYLGQFAGRSQTADVLPKYAGSHALMIGFPG